MAKIIFVFILMVSGSVFAADLQCYTTSAYNVPKKSSCFLDRNSAASWGWDNSVSADGSHHAIDGGDQSEYSFAGLLQNGTGPSGYWWAYNINSPRWGNSGPWPYLPLFQCNDQQFPGFVSNSCRPKCDVGFYLGPNNNCQPLAACPNGLCEQPELGVPNTCTGNPINTATGNKFQTEPDFIWGNGLKFTRYYNGSSVAEQGLGIGWKHNLMRRIVPVAPILDGVSSSYLSIAPKDADPDWLAYYGLINISSVSSVAQYLLEREDGKRFAFSSNGQAQSSTAENPYQLIISPDGFTVKEGTNTESYDKQGKLTQIAMLNGQSMAFSYDESGRLSKIVDKLGRQLVFNYESSIYLSSVQADEVTVASYAYDAGRLSKVTYADNTSRQYLYEDTRNPTLLTGLIDESGQRFASWAYNEQGQAISSEHAGGVDKFTLNFGGEPASGTRWTEETDPLGSVRRYQFKLVAGTWRLQAKDQPGGAGCSAASNNLLYDTNGNITSRTDFNGNKTTHVYDLARNLETSRTEAAGTPLARTISTEWHATWRLPSTIKEPGRTTTFQYDDKANLLNKAITADGQTRRWGWTYADFGQVKTSTDPDGKTSSYQYDAQGNLTALTNAAQQMTQFTRYDANGNPLEILSPDGIKSILTYDARNRLISRQVGAALSGFEYWPTGLLKQATLPSGLVINYLYDAAHRLSEITDNQGHREVYTLNKAGLQEQVDRYDPDSTLANGLLQVQQAQSVKPAK
jgi:YD repeat-containing protein